MIFGNEAFADYYMLRENVQAMQSRRQLAEGDNLAANRAALV